MKRFKRKTIITAAVVAALVAAAVVCRTVARSLHGELLSNVFNLVRSYIYFGLLAVWGVTLYRRVVQVQARKLLVTTALSMLFWIVLRAFKYYFVTDFTAVRYLWYAYYIPMLFIPAFAVLVALSIGKYEGYRLPRRAFLLLVPTTLAAALVMTNDLHQLVFRFPAGAAEWTEKDYGYGVGYILAAAWGVSCGAAALALLFIKSRLPRNDFALWLPIVPFAVAVLYVITYALRVPFVRAVGWDLAVFECLSFAIFFESCISCGLIQSNTRYTELFRASQNLSAQITDNFYNVRYAAENAVPVEKETLIRAEKEPVVEEERLIHVMRIRGGRAVWAEDISELIAARESLEITREELKDRNDFLRHAYKKEEEHKTVEEQNRLYDLLQSKTQRQIDGIDRLVKEYRLANVDGEKRRILAKIAVLGSFIKRRKDFVLLTDETPYLPEGKLANAFAESYRALGGCGIRGAFSVNTGRETVCGEVLTLAYDLFEEVAESVFDRAKYMNVRVFAIKGVLRMSVTLDCELCAEELKRRYPALKTDTDGGETSLYLSLEGGAE